jgi:hypothetical protein
VTVLLTITTTHKASRRPGTALTGRCDARPDLAAAAIPLEVWVPALPCRAGAGLARAVFEPLGWQVEAAGQPLDPAFPQWGDSRNEARR